MKDTLFSWLLERVPGSRHEYVHGESRVHQVGLSCNPLPPEGYGGIETVITNLTRGLVAKDVPVTCYSPSPFEIDGANHVETLPEKTVGPKDGTDSANTREHLQAVVEGLSERVEPRDIVHFQHSQHFPFIYHRLRAKQLSERINYVETAHWTNVGGPRNIAYPSQSNAEQIGKPGRVIPHGIDRSVFSPGPGASGEYVLYAGRITEDKGIHVAAEAASRVGVEFRVAGPKVDEEYAESFIDDVNYIGEVDQEELVRQYRGAEALVYLTQYTEPFGLAPVEAMSCGTPVITTGAGGTGETVVDGETGFICSGVEGVRDAIRRLDQLDRADCISRAEGYSIASMTSQYINYYTDNYA